MVRDHGTFLVMAITSTVSGTCKYRGCQNEREAGIAYKECCSWACYQRKQGRKLLNTLSNTHTHCGTCGSKLKSLEKPPEGKSLNIGPVDHPGHESLLSTDVLIGYQYGTKHADTGEKTRFIGDEQLDATGIICDKCGATDQNEEYDTLREISLFEYTQSILDSLLTDAKKEEHQSEINQSDVYRVLIDTGDLELALGVGRE